MWARCQRTLFGERRASHPRAINISRRYLGLGSKPTELDDDFGAREQIPKAMCLFGWPRGLERRWMGMAGGAHVRVQQWL